MAKMIDKANGVIFRTNLGESGETAVVFPTKKAGASTLEVCEV